MKENCTDNCGNVEKPQPPSVGMSSKVSVEYTNSVEDSMGAAIAGSTFLVGIKAGLEYAAGATHGTKIVVENTFNITLSACHWIIYEARLQICEGKMVQCTGDIRKRAVFVCPHGTWNITGGYETVTETARVKQAVQSSAWTGVLSNGTCPPDPPINY